MLVDLGVASLVWTIFTVSVKAQHGACVTFTSSIALRGAVCRALGATYGRQTDLYSPCTVSVGAFACYPFVMSVRLSACITAALTGQISAKFDTGVSMKICPETTNLIKIGQVT